jgi:zinc protease
MDKKLFFFIAITLLLNGCAPKMLSKKIEQFKFPPLPETTLPSYTKEVLPNGLTLILMEDRSLPLINFYSTIKTGTKHDPEEKIGLASITFDTIRTGGAGDISGDDIDKTLENFGARLSFGVGKDIGWAQGLIDTDNFTHIFPIFVALLKQPSFEKTKIELSKIRHNTAISRRDDDIDEISNREFRKLLYGTKSPYARTIEYETIKNITQDDIFQFHKTFFQPQNIILGVWGDFDKNEMLQYIKKEFKTWSPERVPIPSTPKIDFAINPSTTNLIIKKEATQSIVKMGHIGLRRDDPDYFTALVISRILGASWNSRFSKNIRQEKGLAYSAWAGFGGELGYTGTFSAGVQTKSERTLEAIALMQKEISLASVGITDEELTVAKEGIINSEVFWSDTKDKIITRIIRYEFYGYPSDYPQKLIQGVKNVTREDIARVANKYIFPDKLTILIVGNPEKFEGNLPNNINILEP